MPLPDPHPGLVISYAYLWHQEFLRGQEEGTKARPCAVVLAVQGQQGETVVTVVPVTHAPPSHIDDAVELPAPTKRRLGLDDERSWVVVSEVNRFIWPGPDLRPVPGQEAGRFAYRTLPPSLFETIKKQLLERAARQRLAAVPRTE